MRRSSCCNAGFISNAYHELKWDSSLGGVDPDTVRKVVKEVTQDEKDRLARFDARPSLDECLSLHDFEVCLLPPLIAQFGTVHSSYYNTVSAFHASH